MPSAELAPGRTMTSAGRAAAAGAANVVTRASSRSGTAIRRTRAAGEPGFAVVCMDHPPAQVLRDKTVSMGATRQNSHDRDSGSVRHRLPTYQAGRDVARTHSGSPPWQRIAARTSVFAAQAAGPLDDLRQDPVRGCEVVGIEAGVELGGDRGDGIGQPGVQGGAFGGQLRGARTVWGAAADQPSRLQPGKQRGDRGQVEPELPLPGEELVERGGRRGGAADGQDAQGDVLVAGGGGVGEDPVEQGPDGSTESALPIAGHPAGQARCAAAVVRLDRGDGAKGKEAAEHARPWKGPVPSGHAWSRGLMDTGQVAALLGQTELFGRLGEAALSALAERTTQRTFHKGAVVFVQEELGDRMFVVAEGSVRLLIHSHEGEIIELVRRTPPEVFGELAVLDGGPRSATAEATQRTRLVVVTRRDLIDLLRSEQVVVEALLFSIGALVRRANRQTADLAFLTVADRVAGRLLELAGWQDEETAPERLQPVHVTQTDLAQMVNGARQTVNKVLGNFESRGLIRVAGQTIVLVHPRQLHRLAGR